MRLKAIGFKEWLRARGLFLECLCPLVMEINERTRVPAVLLSARQLVTSLRFAIRKKWLGDAW